MPDAAKTVPAKLGLRPDVQAWAYQMPEELGAVLPFPTQAPAMCGFSIAFVRSRSDVAPALAAVLPHYRRGGHFWMAYPKKSGRVATDISRDSGWEPLDAHDLLPVAQVAIDADWSALRFRYRDEIRLLTRKRDRP